MKPSHWAYKEIKKTREMGLLIGVGGNRFKPNANVTRAEMAQLIERYFDGENETKKETSSIFKDLDKAKWSISAVEELVELGIILPSEYSNGKFEPNKAITRIEMSKWLTRALAVQHSEYAEYEKVIHTSQHTILPVTEFYANKLSKADWGYIGVMLGTEMFIGYPNGAFKADILTNRAEVATLAIRLHEKLNIKPTDFTGLNEIVEVSKTATNMLSISPFKYLSFSVLFS